MPRGDSDLSPLCASCRKTSTTPPVINAGDNDQAVTGAGRRTQLEYDDHGRLTKRIDPDPDGIGPVEAPETTHTYDALGRRTQTTEPDPDGDGAQTAAVTTYTYDHLSRQTQVTDA
ncbi:MAG: hypothetical protein ACQESR_26635, partial [Planctomycetota bacterium]